MPLVDTASEQEPALFKNLPLKSGGFVLRMFGPLILESGDRQQTKFPTKRSALLLACLAVARDHRIGRDELAEMLWPDDYLDLTRIRLRQELRRLRQAVEGFGCCLRSDRQWVEIEPGCLYTDVQAFDAAMVSATVALNTHSKVEYLNKAVSLLNGPFLSGHQEPWVHATRRTYNEKARRAWMALADAHQSLNDHERALDATINAVRHDPLDSDANMMLIRRLVERGQRARARQAFLEFDAMMFRELGCHAPSSVRAALGIVASDQDEPQRLAETCVRAQISRPLPLFGRDDLLATIEASLARPGACVLTVGMIGVGKTHLIREAAWRFARANDLPIQFGGTPERTADGLFVIDSRVEQSSLIELMNRATQLGWRVLAESRRRIDSCGFEEILVSPLPTPALNDTAETVYANPSVQLLISQMAEDGAAKSTSTEAVHLAELARRLDGLPAALRFYSSRLMVGTPVQILNGLDESLPEFVSNPTFDGESVYSTLSSAVSDLPPHVVEAFLAMSLLDGASLDLATRLSAPYDFTDVWRSLERRSLVTIQGSGPSRRIRVPAPFAVAAKNLVEETDLSRIVDRVWRALADWAFELSRRLTGPQQDLAYHAIASELGNIRRGLIWAIENEPRLAAYLGVASWRTICARGNPSADSDLLYRAAELGASLLSPELEGEPWTGAGIALSIVGRLDISERAFLNGARIYSEAGNLNLLAWNNMNYAVYVVVHSDKERAIQLLQTSAEQATNPNLRSLALSDYATMLASSGEAVEAVRVAEEVFAQRLLTEDKTAHARAYVDLGELYHITGRPEAARPLLLEGIRRLREAGIQNMLLDQLVFLAEISMQESTMNPTLTESLLDEASGIATRIGVKRQVLALARVRMAYASRSGDRGSLISAIEETFRLTQDSQCPKERERSLRLLALELKRLGKHEYANSVLCALGDDAEGLCHTGWRSLLSTDSHTTNCVLAVVLAKEALA